MAHFAQLDESNTVINVIVVGNDDLLDENGIEIEENGIRFCKKLFGEDTVWVQTSYNRNFRKNYAGIGMTYDPIRDAFIHTKPYNSWILNDDTCLWEAPVPFPEDGLPVANKEDQKFYRWDEDNLQWIQMNNPYFTPDDLP